MKKTAYGGTKITDLTHINKNDYKLKEKIEQRFFKIVSKNEGMICADLWSENNKDDDGIYFSIKYMEFPDSIVKNNND